MTKEEEKEEAYLEAFKELCSPNQCVVPDDMIMYALLGSESHWTPAFIEKVKKLIETTRPSLLEKINESLLKTV